MTGSDDVERYLRPPLGEPIEYDDGGRDDRWKVFVVAVVAVVL